MNYTEYKPSSSLSKIVKNYWRFEVANDGNIKFPLEHETLPHSEISLIYIHQPNFKGIKLLGPQTKKIEKTIYPDSIYFGIRLLPWLTFDSIILDKLRILNSLTDC